METSTYAVETSVRIGRAFKTNRLFYALGNVLFRVDNLPGSTVVLLVAPFNLDFGVDLEWKEASGVL